MDALEQLRRNHSQAPGPRAAEPLSLLSGRRGCRAARARPLRAQARLRRPRRRPRREQPHRHALLHGLHGLQPALALRHRCVDDRSACAGRHGDRVRAGASHGLSPHSGTRQAQQRLCEDYQDRREQIRPLLHLRHPRHADDGAVPHLLLRDLQSLQAHRHERHGDQPRLVALHLRSCHGLAQLNRVPCRGAARRHPRRRCGADGGRAFARHDALAGHAQSRFPAGHQKFAARHRQ